LALSPTHEPNRHGKGVASNFDIATKKMYPLVKEKWVIFFRETEDARLTIKHDVLKKATAYFAQHVK
jgi:hypothetical protein